jgi:hypothetical protein
MKATIRVSFSAHVPLKQVSRLTTGIGVYGLVSIGSSAREVVIEISRPSRLPKIKRQLTLWERYGFLRWSEDDQVSN